MNQTEEHNKGAGSVLKIPNFRSLWIGQTISQMGDGLTNLAILIVVNQLTGSTKALATVAIALALPQLLIGLFAGVVVDRFDRRRIMIVSDILRGFVVIGFIFVREPSQVWIFYVLAFIQAAIGTFFDPAKSALIPNIVESSQLLAANGLSQTTRVITNVIGTALAGVLIGLAHGAWLPFSLDALTFFISAIFITRIVLSGQEKVEALQASDDSLAQLKEGLRFTVQHRLIGVAMFTLAITMLGLGAVNVLFVPFMVNILQTPINWIGFLEAAQVIGMIVGSSLVALLASRLKLSQLISIGVFLLGGLIMLVGTLQNAWSVGLALFVVGLTVMPVQVAVSTIMQRHVPNEMRGRVGAALNTVLSLASVISMALSGVLGDALGIRQVFFLSGVIAMGAGLFAILMMKEPAPQPVMTASAD